VRSGLGLAYLLLGVMKYDGDNDNSIQFLFQSIQHLKAAVGLTDESDSEEIGDAIQNAAMHNLGLAYMALDGKSSSEALVGEKTTHFLDWVTSLRSSQATQSVMESWVFSANEGAVLLQMGKIEDAISSLESTASQVCSDSFPSSRQKETCVIVLQNLAVARNSLYGEKGEPSIYAGSGDERTIHVEVARWNADASSESFTAVVTDPEQSETMDATFPSEDDISKTTDVSDGENKTSAAIEEINDASSEAETNTELVDIVVDGKIRSGLELGKNEEVIALPSTVKPEMQNALAALEKAAAEGTQRARLLLALARARSLAGDLSGAVDAALKAIGAATSEEESETSTLYLETLMEKMAGEGMEETIQIIPEEQPLEMPEKTSTFIESKDFALSQALLKLELEKLKYKVLEQEMMLGRHNNQPQYANDMNVRAIDYQREMDSIVHDTPRRRPSNVIEENIVTSETAKKPVELETEVDLIQEEATLVDDVEDSDPVVLKNDTDNANHEESPGNQTLTQSQNADTESSPEVVPADQAEPDENQELPSEGVNDINATDADEETPAAEFVEAVESVQEVEPVEAVEPVQEIEPVQLPSLFSPTLKSPTAISPTAKSYMKMADAYLDKGQYALASKQFLKVMKKAPDHLPAYLGYATALERTGKSKQISTAALAYGNATQVAIIQGESVDPMAKAGTGGIAENILRRAVQLAKASPTGKLETLQLLSTSAHTAALAADIYYEIGAEIVKEGTTKGDKKDDAILAFRIANEFVAMRNDTEIPNHIRSIIKLGKIALEYEDNAVRVIDLFNEVKDVHMEDDVHVELLVLVGRAHASRGELETAITEFTRALSFPQSSSTPSAHHELAITLKKNNGDTHEINLHFEKALDMGMDPTSEAIEALGERSMSVMRALNRQYYKQSANSGSAERTGGGIMSGGGVGSRSSSVFAPKAKQTEEASAQSDALTMLEQGAAAYDGHTPMGGEVEGTPSSLSNLKVKKQQGSESNLASKTIRY